VLDLLDHRHDHRPRAGFFPDQFSYFALAVTSPPLKARGVSLIIPSFAFQLRPRLNYRLNPQSHPAFSSPDETEDDCR